MTRAVPSLGGDIVDDLPAAGSDLAHKRSKLKQHLLDTLTGGADVVWSPAASDDVSGSGGGHNNQVDMDMALQKVRTACLPCTCVSVQAA